MRDFFEACREHRAGLKAHLGLSYAETIDRWVRFRTISAFYKKRVLEYFKNKKIEIGEEKTTDEVLLMKFKGKWYGLIDRCKRGYTKRKIQVCERWKNFEYFKEDLYEDYKTHYKKYGAINTTLDRIDNRLGYAPGNCRWATQKEQNNNRRNNTVIVFRGKTKTLSEWADDIGITISALLFRINKWGMNKALSTPKLRN